MDDGKPSERLSASGPFDDDGATPADEQVEASPSSATTEALPFHSTTVDEETIVDSQLLSPGSLPGEPSATKETARSTDDTTILDDDLKRWQIMDHAEYMQILEILRKPERLRSISEKSSTFKYSLGDYRGAQVVMIGALVVLSTQTWQKSVASFYDECWENDIRNKKAFQSTLTKKFVISSKAFLDKWWLSNQRPSSDQSQDDHDAVLATQTLQTTSIYDQCNLDNSTNINIVYANGNDPHLNEKLARGVLLSGKVLHALKSESAGHTADDVEDQACPHAVMDRILQDLDEIYCLVSGVVE